MSNLQNIQIEEIIDMHTDSEDYEAIADQIANGEMSGLTEALVDYFADEIPYGVITGDDMTTDEWIADKVAELES